MSAARTALRAQIATALADVSDIVANVDAGAYATAAAFEADANAARATLADLIAGVDAAWAADGVAMILALKALAARLLDLRAALPATTAAATVTQAAEQRTSLVQLAVALYGDYSRWTDLLELNRAQPHPGFIAAGAEVVRHVA